MDQRDLITDLALRTHNTPRKRKQGSEDGPRPADTLSTGAEGYHKRPRTPNTAESSTLISSGLASNRNELDFEQHASISIKRYAKKVEGFTADRDRRSLITERGSNSEYQSQHGDGIRDTSEAGLIECYLEQISTPHLITPKTHQQYEESDRSIQDACKCFGMLLITDVHLQPGFFRKSGQVVVIDGFAIRDTESGTYVGMLDETVGIPLIQLASIYPIYLLGILRGEKHISVIVYGAQSDASNIGRFLVERKLWLQHPDTQFVPPTFYYNPQWLTPLGAVDYMPPRQYHEEVSFSTAPLKPNSMALPILSELLESAIGPRDFSEPQFNEMMMTELKTYQRKAVAMMIEKEAGKLKGEGAEFDTVWERLQDNLASSSPVYRNTVTGSMTTQRPKLCLGGLLADEMGLGKTLTVLALVAGTVKKDDVLNIGYSSPTLIIVPLSTLSNWEDQIKRHFKPGSLSYITYHGSNREMTAASLRGYDLVLTTYDTIKADSRSEGKSTWVVLPQKVQWYRIVLDEAHIIRNRSPRLECIRLMEAKHRWCLTGTPIQNRLEDLGALVEFLRISPFDNLNVFQDQFVTSISNEPSERWRRLRLLVNAISLRRTKKEVFRELNLRPPKRIDQPVQLNDDEKQVYDLLKHSCIRGIDPLCSTKSTFQAILRLRQVCNHGRDLLTGRIQQWLNQNGSTSDTSILHDRYCEGCEKSMGNNEDGSLGCLHQICASCQEATRIESDEDDENVCPVCSGSPSKTRSYLERSRDPPLACPTYRPSSKVKALLRNLNKDREAYHSGNTSIKSIIFSEWVTMLDLVAQGLRLDGFSFARIDGQKTLSQRIQSLNAFRNDSSCNILLATLGSAGVGVDLSIASRVHLLEPNWNPMLEQQALDRVHRLGQTQEVITICYYIAGDDSVEEYVKQKQQWKRHIASFSFSDTPAVTQSQYISLLCKDLQSMLQGADG